MLEIDEGLEECGIEELYGASPPQVLPQTEPLYRTTLREAKDRLEDLRRIAPDEFYRRRQIIEAAIKEREQGKTKTMSQFTLSELQELLRFTDRIYR